MAMPATPIPHPRSTEPPRLVEDPFAGPFATCSFWVENAFHPGVEFDLVVGVWAGATRDCGDITRTPLTPGVLVVAYDIDRPQVVTAPDATGPLHFISDDPTSLQLADPDGNEYTFDLAERTLTKSAS